MVRLNKQTDFQFPFLASDTSSIIHISKSHLDFADRVLSIFACTFFFAIILAISLDNSNSTNYSSTNHITSELEPKMQTIIPLALANFSQDEIQIKPIKNAKNLNTKNLSLVPLKVEISKKEKIENPISKITQTNFKEVLPIEKKVISNSTKNFPTNDIHLNQPRISSETKEAIVKSFNKTLKVSPKPVLVDRKITTEDLVLNEKITQDLLPLSYFHAKEKAEIEGKLMYIKFGAKWCLPCRQMEKTTFKDERIINFSEENYVSLSVDVDDFDGVNMKSYFNVEFLPTILVFNSQGKFIAKYVNFQSADNMLRILEKHKSENHIIPAVASNELVKSPEFSTPNVEKIASINFNKVILSKKRNGKRISSLKSKAKNWRYTQLNFSTKNISEGELLLQVKETITGLNLTELNIPVIKNQGIADTTTTNFQLVLEHEKRKKKNGEYVMEIYHLTQNDSMLVGKTTLLKDGEIHF